LHKILPWFHLYFAQIALPKLHSWGFHGTNLHLALDLLMPVTGTEISKFGQIRGQKDTDAIEKGKLKRAHKF